MDRKRAAILEKIEAGFGSEGGDADVGHSQLLELVNVGKEEEPFDWSAFLGTVGRKFLPRVCEAIAYHVSAALQDGEGSIEAMNAAATQAHVDDATQPALDALHVLQVAVDVAHAFTQNTKLPAPDMLVQTVRFLHDVLLHLHGGRASVLQENIAQLMEAWWAAGRPGRLEVAPQTMAYLTVKSLEEGASPRLVRRLWNMREALLELDFDDESISSMTELLLRCFLNPLYLRSRGEGRRFLAFLFGLHPGFIDEIHATIKNQLPCAKSMVDAYGEVYFRAWRGATGVYLTRVEQGCIQDFMELAIMSAVPATYSCLRTILARFVAEKKQAGVDEMLLRLYEPLLWRNLNAANPAVRRNTAMLFIDAFPLQKHDAPRAELEAVLQRQFDALAKLLVDPEPTVRVVGVHGVCRVLGVFWELIPAVTTKSLLTQLVTKLAYDTRSTAVRAAVFQGLEYVLDNALSYPVMKMVLPALSQSIHDRSERVRKAVVSMLLAVLRIRDIHFADIVSVDNLLARLVLDSECHTIASGITQLLQPSFMPQKTAGSVQLTRAVELIEKHPAAACVFYRYAHEHVRLSAVAKVILMLYKALRHALKNSGGTTAGAKRGRGKGKGKGKAGGKARASENDASAANSAGDDTMSTSNRTLMKAILEAITTMWESVHDDIEAATDLRAELHKHFTVDFMEQLFDAFPPQEGSDSDADDDADVSAALLGLLGVMPASHAETLQQNMWNKLAELTPDTAQAGLTQVLNSLCRWGMGDQVWSRVLAALRVAFGADVADESGAVIHPVVAVLAAEHLATTDCCGVWSDLLACSRAEPPAAGKNHSKGRTQPRGVRLQDLLDAFEFATTSMEMSMEELFAGEQLSDEVTARDVGADVAAPLALRATCTLALLEAGHAGLEARKGADVPALSMPYTVVRLLGWTTSTALPLLRRASKLTPGDVATLCAEPAAGKRKGRGASAAATASVTRRNAVHRRVRALYDACAVTLGVAADCVGLGMADPAVVDAVSQLFGLGVAPAPSSPGAGAGAGAGAADEGGMAAGGAGFVDIVVAVPPPEPSSSAGHDAAPKGKTSQQRGRKRQSASVAAPACASSADVASRSSMTTPLLLQSSRLVAQAAKAGMLPATSASDIVWQVLRASPASVLSSASRPTAEEARLAADAASIRVRPFVSAALWLHTRAGSLDAGVSKLVSNVASLEEVDYPEAGGQWAPPGLEELPPVAAAVPLFLVRGGEQARTSMVHALLKSLKGDTGVASFSILAAALASTPEASVGRWWGSVAPQLDQLAAALPEEESDLAGRLQGMSQWITSSS